MKRINFMMVMVFVLFLNCACAGEDLSEYFFKDTYDDGTCTIRGLTLEGADAFREKYNGKVIIPKKINGFQVTEVYLADGKSPLFPDHLLGLTEIVIPNSVTEIYSNAFDGFKDLTMVKIPSSVKTIGEGVFDECENLKEIRIPETVEMLEPNAFTFDTVAEQLILFEGNKNSLPIQVDGIDSDWMRSRYQGILYDSILDATFVAEKERNSSDEFLKDLILEDLIRRGLEPDCPFPMTESNIRVSCDRPFHFYCFSCMEKENRDFNKKKVYLQRYETTPTTNFVYRVFKCEECLGE